MDWYTTHLCSLSPYKGQKSKFPELIFFILWPLRLIIQAQKHVLGNVDVFFTLFGYWLCGGFSKWTGALLACVVFTLYSLQFSMEHQAFRLVRSIQSIMLPKLQAKFGFTGSSTHDLAVCNLQAHWSVTILQTCVRKQSLPYQAYLAPVSTKTSATTSLRPHITRTFKCNALYMQRLVHSALATCLGVGECWWLFDETPKRPTMFWGGNVRFVLGKLQCLRRAFSRSAT